MPLNKQIGNMYPWITHTWNPIKGCNHDCIYCYVKDLARRYNYSLKPRFDEKELKINLGSGNKIFVGSTSDMFGYWIPDGWIKKILNYCEWDYPDNTYLFQSKNPKRFHKFLENFPRNIILGTTIETNYDFKWISKAPLSSDRKICIETLNDLTDIMISIEPVIDFDLKIMIRWMKDINPKFISMGADSKNHGLPEPSSDKIKKLITELNKFTEVKIKNNLNRLLK